MQARPYLRSLNFYSEIDADWSQYPLSIPAVNDLDKIEFHPDVTFFVGENGAGKSTILEAIARVLGFPEEGGTKNVNYQTVGTTSKLSQYLKPIRSHKKPKDGYFLRAESFYNVASYMDEVHYLDGYGGKSLHARSHGEAFLSILTDKLQGHGLYLFDEPEAALSPSRILTMIAIIDQLVKQESQFIIATHSPILLAYPNAKILQFSDQGIKEVQYEETDHFMVTKDFLNNYPKRIRQLIEDEY